MPHTMLNSGIESRFIDLMCYWHSCCCYLFMLVNSVSEIILSVHSTTWMNIYLYVLQYTIDLPHFPWENFKTVCVRPKLGIKFTICEINICQPHLSIHTSHVGECQYYFNVPCLRLRIWILLWNAFISKHLLLSLPPLPIHLKDIFLF